MSARRREIPEELREELAEQRAAGAASIAELAAQGRPLHRIAFLNGAEEAISDLIHDAVEQARDARYQWREISEASGLGDSDEASAVAQMRHRRRT